EPLPSWAADHALGRGQGLRGVKYLLTFQPFGRLPPPVRAAYLAGTLHLLPFPGSLFAWGIPDYLRLQAELPLALQLPLLQLVGRHEAPVGLRVPQSGWFHEPGPKQPEADQHYGPLLETYKRTHRWGRVHRHEDELAVI